MITCITSIMLHVTLCTPPPEMDPVCFILSDDRQAWAPRPGRCEEWADEARGRLIYQWPDDAFKTPFEKPVAGD